MNKQYANVINYHDSVKINACHFITFKIKERSMNERSLKNLHGKVNEGFLSEKSSRLIENTVFNYLYNRYGSYQKQKENAENTAPTPIHPPNAHTQKPTHGVDCVGATVR